MNASVAKVTPQWLSNTGEDKKQKTIIAWPVGLCVSAVSVKINISTFAWYIETSMHLQDKYHFITFVSHGLKERRCYLIFPFVWVPLVTLPFINNKIMNLFGNLGGSAECNADDRGLAYEFSEGILRVSQGLLLVKFMWCFVLRICCIQSTG